MAERERRSTPPFGGVFVPRTEVMNASDVRRAIKRIGHEIVERNHGLEDVVLVGLQTGGLPLAAGIAGALRDRVAVERQAGRDDQGVELGEVGAIQVGQLGAFGQLRARFFACIPRRDLRPAGPQRGDRRQPGARQAVDRIMLAGPGGRRDHRSFSVLSPASASTKATIQKRMTTVGSDHPLCSK